MLLAEIALAFWVVRELIRNTFKDSSKKKPYIISFALAGFSIALALIVGGRFMPRDSWLLRLILCPSALLEVVFIDVPHPPTNLVIVMSLLTAVMNSALYAAI